MHRPMNVRFTYFVLVRDVGGVLKSNSSRFDAAQCRMAKIKSVSGLAKRANGYEDLRSGMPILTVAKTVTALRLRGGGQSLCTSH